MTLPVTVEAQLVNAWAINNRIDLYVLEALAQEALGGVSASKGRSAGEVIAHIHNVRLMWLQSAAPSLMAGLAKLDKEAAGRIKGFKPDPAAFFGSIVAHDAYHRGEVGIIAKQSGHPLPDKVLYGEWEWGLR